MIPLIGITTYLEQATWGPWDTAAALVPHAYVRAVAEAGGRPVLIPPVDLDLEHDPALEALDGLILTGGPDLEPARYGARREAETAGVQPARDAAEFGLLGDALERDLPTLAICRGMQALNVLRGGDLIQHLEGGDVDHRLAPGTFNWHQVTIVGDTRLAEILGNVAQVASHHHQAPRDVGGGLVVNARAADGIVEGFEDPTHTFVLGVLWHPEEEEESPLFTELVQAARAHRFARGTTRSS